MSAVPFQLVWGPGAIGLAVAGALYGVGIGQFAYYVQAFPRDLVQLKLVVFIAFILDSIQTLTLTWTYYHLLVACRLSDSPGCVIYLPVYMIVGVFTVFVITFIVQSFYAHRVWIISGRNRVITFAVLASALTQLVLGLCSFLYSYLLLGVTDIPGWHGTAVCIAGLIRTPTLQVLFTIEFSPLAAIASAVCDAIITVSIMYYLRPARTGVNRQGNYIKKLNVIFVQMGLLSFINATAVAIMYYIQDHGVAQFLTAAPGLILSKTYMNSMLSVLNARKPIRDQQRAEAERTIEMPTIPTIR